MAYREKLTTIGTLDMFAPPRIVAQVEQALETGQTVEYEYTSFNDPGPDETRILVNGQRVLTIPGY